MEANNQKIATLRNLLDDDASKFISGEISLKNKLSEWINEASSVKLKGVLQRYLEFIEQHLDNLENFMNEENIHSFSIRNPVMIAFISETEEKLMRCSDVEVKDACLLAGIQSINHYKISTYGTAASFSNSLGMERQASIFHEAEVNEKHIDDRLSQLAQFEINIKARSPIVLPG